MASSPSGGAARAIIIDTDPGQDDAAAIMLALANPAALNVLGLTVVAGNVPIAQTTINALALGELCGRPDLPIHVGAARPLARAPRDARQAHGASGMDGADLPAPAWRPDAEPAFDFLRRTLLAAPSGTVTLCGLGPLTNLARLAIAAPEAFGRIREIVLMGGSVFEGGNVTPAAEFNIAVDPEAAAAVFAGGVPIVMMPLDVTHRLLATAARRVALDAVQGRCAETLGRMLDASAAYYRKTYGFEGRALHDPSVIAYLLRPALFEGRACNVRIETQSDLTAGMTVVDWWGVTDLPRNATVMRGVDVDGFFELLTTSLARLP